ncbi:hypothetical protein [Streptomyces yaizuensis]|uniref:Uncharacterized protein n=1 Tax=Streptomyces yaizuensis TaxID=2989713 RepID=A0ABQ5NR62_9ACTN|nr:hypothetical protein [Streptomyces sp. YSPA8]GLF92862.1 hypothetical protein SYYSPA8_01215 [Streptomyces sp. YSPA8]
MKTADGQGMHRFTGLAVVLVLSGAALTVAVESGHTKPVGHPPSSTGSASGPVPAPAGAGD